MGSNKALGMMRRVYLGRPGERRDPSPLASIVAGGVYLIAKTRLPGPLGPGVRRDDSWRCDRGNALPQIQFLEKVIALVVDDGEGPEIPDLDAPGSLPCRVQTHYT